MSNSTHTSSEDASFLKMATASPDFENLNLEGVPDSYSGPTFVKKDYVYTTITAPAGDETGDAHTLIIVAPTAGVSYYANDFKGPYADTEVKDLTFFGDTHVFPDASTIFPGCGLAPGDGFVGNTAECVAGRIIGHAAELVCVNNPYNQYGTITTFKTPIHRTMTSLASGTSVSQRLVGLPALFADPVQAAADITPVGKGSYAVAMSKESEFNFYDVLDDVQKNTIFLGYNVAGLPGGAAESAFKGPSVLWDNGFDSIIFRVDVPTGVAAQVFILKIWRTWEFQPAANSLAASIAHSSPPHSPHTLDVYHEMAKVLPVSVPASQNPDFWKTVLTAVREGSDLLSHIPVPQIAMVAKGVHAAASLADAIVDKTSRPKRVAVKARTSPPRNNRTKSRRKKGRARKR
jgi:hypothetical protein